MNILLTVNRSAKCERGSKKTKRAAMNEFHEGTKQIRNTNQAKRDREKEKESAKSAGKLQSCVQK